MCTREHQNISVVRLNYPNFKKKSSYSSSSQRISILEKGRSGTIMRAIYSQKDEKTPVSSALTSATVGHRVRTETTSGGTQSCSLKNVNVIRAVDGAMRPPRCVSQNLETWNRFAQPGPAGLTVQTASEKKPFQLQHPPRSQGSRISEAFPAELSLASF